MASTSCATTSPLRMKEAATSNYYPYPSALAKYEDVVADPKLFLTTLEKLHANMRTKFMIPIIGGKELDLHKLFVEVTARGGIGKVIRERRWKEITAGFNFPSTATNASFVLRKYYVSLLHHYEQIYFFKALRWTPNSVDSLQSPNAATVPSPWPHPVQPLPYVQAYVMQQPGLNPTDFSAAARPHVSAGCPLTGVIDGKFESGYLVTVIIGSEELKGVLYEAPYNSAQHVPQPLSTDKDNASTARVHRRRRRKKSEIKRRDPAHPKPNRSGYNFFFAEQHARLKPLHPGKDREISRMIGERWNKLTESEKTIYQDKAAKDKERYKTEMEDYRERLKNGQLISDAVPLQQCLPEPDLNMIEAADTRTDETETKSADSPQTPENDSSSCKSISEDDDMDAEKDLVADELSLGLGLGIESSNVGMDVSVVDRGSDPTKIEAMNANVREEITEKIGDET